MKNKEFFQQVEYGSVSAPVWHSDCNKGTSFSY